MTSRSGRPGPVLLVASSGGHIEELHLLVPRVLPAARARHWLTFDTPQTRDLLGEDPVTFLRPSGPRDVAGLARSLPTIVASLARLRPAAVVSTGAAVAVPAMTLGRALRAEVVYIESAARTDGPSLTGRLLQRLPSAKLFAQWPDWQSGSWAFGGGVFDGFRSVETGDRPLRSVFVTLGTQRTYAFGRLLSALRRQLRSDTEVFVQHGATPLTSGLHGRPFLAPAEFARRVTEADAVVAHAGVGTALMTLQLGRIPVLVPREAAHGEHVDDHQAQIARRLAAMDLAVGRRVDELTTADLSMAGSRSAVRVEARPLQSREPLLCARVPRR